MIVYRTTSKIPVKSGKHTIIISPLSHEQYAQVTSNIRYEGGKVIQDRAGMIATALRYCIKGFESKEEVHFHDGAEFKLKWDGELLSQESLDMLYQILGTGEMSVIGTNVTAGTIGDLPIVKVERQAKSVPLKKKQA